MTLRDAFADLLGSPANSANSAKTRMDACSPADSGACESLRILRIAPEPVAVGGVKFAKFASVRKAENEPTARASACDSQDSQDSQSGNPLMTREQADRAHAPAWDDQEIDRVIARVHQFMRRGIGADRAEHLAERLLLRDRDFDDRHMCIECRHGRAARCPDGAPLPRDVLHRCPSIAI